MENKTNNDAVWAKYLSNSHNVTGLAKDVGDGWFRFQNMMMTREGYAGMLFEREEIEFLPIEIREEDIVAMIDLALQAGDYKWFNELSSKLANKEYEAAE